MKKILIAPSMERSLTRLYIGHDLLTSDCLKQVCDELKKIPVIISDSTVKDLYGDQLSLHLQAALIELPQGHRTKSRESVEHVFKELFSMGIGRDVVLIALGGGSTTDLTGFAASIYMRGVPHIFIPTTLMGMVDAAIGGKTAIDTAYGKNLIGTVYHPQAIFADLQTLATLSRAEWLNGIAEILKMGLIADAAICQLAQKNFQDPELIYRAIQAKVRIVEQDPNDQSLRRILNFGHTIGHGLEAVAHFEIAHGLAVAIGSLVEAHLSVSLGYLSKEDFAEIQALYTHFPLRLPLGYSRKELLCAMSYDKKKKLGHMRFALIDQIGRAMSFDGAYCCNVSADELESSLEWMENRYG